MPLLQAASDTLGESTKRRDLLAAKATRSGTLSCGIGNVCTVMLSEGALFENRG